LILFSRIEDIAHAYAQEWCTVSDIQEIAIGGICGHQSGVLEPFKTLSIGQLQQELRVLDIYHN
jgi:hypothetical protein